MPRLWNRVRILTATSLLLAHPRWRRPRHAPVDELDTPGAELDVVNRAVELHLVAVDAEVAAGEARAVGARVVELDDLRLRAAGEARALERLLGEQGGDAAVQRLAEVRQPHVVAGDRVAAGPWPAR